MFSYIRRHWVVYLILFLTAIAVGLGAAYVVGVKGSTPASTLAEEVQSEQSDGTDDVSASSDGGAAATDSTAESDTAQ